MEIGFIIAVIKKYDNYLVFGGRIKIGFAVIFQNWMRIGGFFPLFEIILLK